MSSPAKRGRRSTAAAAGAGAAPAPGPARLELLGSAVLSPVDPITLAVFTEQMAFWIPEARKPSLLFRMSRDGTGVADFHMRCDGKGPTVVLIRSDNGFVFGGYAGKAWHSKDSYITCADSFIFTLLNPHGIPPTRYLVNDPSYALYASPELGPCFGNAAVRVGGYCGDGLLSTFGYTTFKYYTDTTGKGPATFTGATDADGTYTPAEVEVSRWRV